MNTLLGQSLLDLFYPIGSGYLTKSSSFNPNTAFNNNSCSSTWVLSSKGKAIVGVDSGNSNFNQAGKTGGSLEHNHTLNNGYACIIDNGSNAVLEKPKRLGTSGIVYYAETSYPLGGNVSRGSYGQDFGTCLGGTTDNTSNLQPYECWYIWERTA